MNKRELMILTYAIGISEASAKRRIVPAAHSSAMMEFLREHPTKSGEAVYLIQAYNEGVAAEISQQTRAELKE